MESYVEWKNWKDGSFGAFDPGLASYFRAETGIAAAPGVRVLEIGFGNGAFIGWCLSIGVEVLGVELSAMLVARARALLGGTRAFGDLHDPELSAARSSFSHIVAFDVLEHIPQGEIPAFLARLAALLAPAGRIILRFPNGDSPFGRIYQHGDPTHVTTIGHMKLGYLAREAGLAVAEVRAPALPKDGVGMRAAARRLLLEAGRRCVERLIGALYFGGRALPLHPNYTAILLHGSGGGPDVH